MRRKKSCNMIRQVAMRDSVVSFRMKNSRRAARGSTKKVTNPHRFDLRKEESPWLRHITTDFL